MIHELNHNRFKDIVCTIIFYVSFIGFGLILGTILFTFIRSEITIARTGGLPVNCYTFVNILYSFKNIAFNVTSGILLIKLFLLILYSLLKGENKRALYIENIFSLIAFLIGIMVTFWVPGCLA